MSPSTASHVSASASSIGDSSSSPVIAVAGAEMVPQLDSGMRNTAAAAAEKKAKIMAALAAARAVPTTKASGVMIV